MKLNIKALALAAGIIWGGAMLIVGIINMFNPEYGAMFLTTMSSIYPGYKPFMGTSSALIGGLYGFVDGGICGAIFAWLYNLFAK